MADLYWCCKTPNTTCTNGICQGKKLPLSQQCHDDTTIQVYPQDGSVIRITHPRCNHYPTCYRGDLNLVDGSHHSRSFIDVCRDNRYDLNLAKYIQAKVRPIIRNFIWVKMSIFWQISNYSFFRARDLKKTVCKIPTRFPICAYISQKPQTWDPGQ